MSIRSSISAHYNYTGRKSIKQKDELFKINISERSENTAIVTLSYDYFKILKSTKIEDSSFLELVLDAYILNNVSRVILNKVEPVHSFKLFNCAEHQNIEFKIKLVTKDPKTKGLLLAANKNRIIIKGSQHGDGIKQEDMHFFRLCL